MSKEQHSKLNMRLYKKDNKRARYTTYVGDFETSTGNEDGSTNVYLWGVSSMDKSERYLGTSMREFFDCIAHYKIKTIYFHNTSFDCQFMVHWLMENGFNYQHSPFMRPRITNTFTWMKDNTTNIYDLQINYKGHIVRIKDTAKLLVEKVSVLGDMLDFPKGEIDYDKYKHFDNISQVPPNLLDYLWRDIDIVIAAFKRFKINFKAHGITAAGTAMKDFKKHYGRSNFIKKFGGYYTDPLTMKQKYNRVLTVKEWDEFKFGYRGGLTVFNEVHFNQHLKNIVGTSYDVNSLYPWVMMSKKMPIGRPYSTKLHKDMLTYQKIFIKSAKRKRKDMPAIIPSNHDMSRYDVNYLSEVEGEYYNLWSWELERWKKAYDMEYRVVKSWYFECEYVFTSWINEKKGLKENATNKIDEKQIKLILNSLYGKNGENYKRKEKEIIYDPDWTVSGTRYGKNGDYVESVVETVSENLSYIPIASAITAYARCVLIDALLANVGRALYCDTDSIYMLGEGVGMELHDTKLGAWKGEIKFSEFKYIKPKCYLAMMTAEYDKYTKKWEPRDKVKRAIAGMSVENHNLVNFSNFNKGEVFTEGKMQKKNVKGGIILHTIKYTL